MISIFTWPVGHAEHHEGAAVRRVPPFLPVATYVVSSTIGGAATGAALTLLGQPARSGGVAREVTAGLLAALVVLACWCEWNGRMRPFVERRAQVPRRWMGWSHPSTTAAAFGLMIGAGVFTYLKHAMAYVLAAAVILAPTPEVGVLVGALYGFGRGMSLGLTWMGDRFVGRRLPRFVPTKDVTPLNRVGAVAAAASFSAVLILVTGG